MTDRPSIREAIASKNSMVHFDHNILLILLHVWSFNSCQTQPQFQVKLSMNNELALESPLPIKVHLATYLNQVEAKLQSKT